MGIRIPRILAAVYGQPWAVTPRTLDAIRASVDLYATRRAMGPVVDPEDDDDAKPYYVSGNVGMILVSGIIGSHLNLMETACGGFDLDSLHDGLDKAQSDARVEQVLMVFRSPGGTITGVPEAALRVAEFPKPIVAFTDGQAASAAYWIASQATEVWIAPSAEVGSIGVYSAIVDESAAWAKEGYKLELMKAGTHKAAGIPGIPLSPEDRALIQADVDKWYGQFTATVSARRPSVSAESMQGQTFSGEDAVAAGLADEVVPSISAALAHLQMVTSRSS